MAIPTDSLAVRHYADLAGLARLRTAASRHATGATDEAARQFESMFIQMMLKAMRDTAQGEGLLDGAHSRLYQDLFDQQISMDIARGKGLGLAPMIAGQLDPRGATAAKGGGDNTRIEAAARSRARGHLASDALALARPAAGATACPRWDRPEDFIQAVWPHAARAARRLSVAPEVLIAQSALETGWGRRIPVDGMGRSSQNLFGIKADAGWAGLEAHVPTLEFEGGVPVRRSAAFRAYDSIAASFDDYASFVRSNPRYRDALAHAGDAETYVRELQRAGYATDPHYADKIIEVMRDVQPATARLKVGARTPLS